MLSVEDLGKLGFKLVISPGALVRAIIPAVEGFLASLKANGSTMAYRDRMTDLAGVNQRVDLAGMMAVGRTYDPSQRDAAE